MSRLGDNNPRGPFTDVVGLRVWRTAYDDNQRSQLFIDVGFKEGRLGAEPGSPVRFRLSVKRAEVRIRPDAAKAIRFVDSSVVRGPIVAGKRTVTSTRSIKGQANADVALNPISPSFSAGASIAAEADFKRAVEFAETVSNMAVQTWPAADGGYSFLLTPDGNKTVLEDRPWDGASPRLLLKDPSHPRKRGEPPEPIVQICCAIEDLQIVDVEFKERRQGFFKDMEREKQIAVVQYLREQLANYGLDVGSSDDKFAVLTLADAIPHETIE